MTYLLFGSSLVPLQMDIKVEGITLAIMREALAAAGAGRRHILGEMSACSPPPRGKLSQYAPRIMQVGWPACVKLLVEGTGVRSPVSAAAVLMSSAVLLLKQCDRNTLSLHCTMLQVTIPLDKVGMAIGPGGRTIKYIQEATGAEVQVDGDSGSVTLKGDSQEACAAAAQLLLNLTADPEVGRVYRGCKVVQVMPFGAFVEVRRQVCLDMWVGGWVGLLPGTGWAGGLC